jgi:hypothetical protein
MERRLKCWKNVGRIWWKSGPLGPRKDAEETGFSLALALVAMQLKTEGLSPKAD